MGSPAHLPAPVPNTTRDPELAYWTSTARHHDLKGEWEWLERLHGANAIVWKGAPDMRALDVSPSAVMSRAA